MNGRVCTCWRLRPDGSHHLGCDFDQGSEGQMEDNE